jgi:D-3-phosphoglycerate dehydrogenase
VHDLDGVSRFLAGPHVADIADARAERGLDPGHPLLSLDNAILTPHLAGMTVESRARMSVAAAEEMLLMLSGKPPKNWVNPK